MSWLHVLLTHSYWRFRYRGKCGHHICLPSTKSHIERSFYRFLLSYVLLQVHGFFFVFFLPILLLIRSCFWCFYLSGSFLCLYLLADNYWSLPQNKTLLQNYLL